nr:MAG TPA: hypothetical protein [Caudoviricetes sp.]
MVFFLILMTSCHLPKIQFLENCFIDDIRVMACFVMLCPVL